MKELRLGQELKADLEVLRALDGDATEQSGLIIGDSDTRAHARAHLARRRVVDCLCVK
jgi:hypothetical protein